jgi:large subunit ribosomal protein L6
MSRVGKLPIKVPGDIKVNIDGTVLTLTKGSEVKTYDFGTKVKVVFEDNEIKVSRIDEEAESKFWGLHRSNINNMVIGLTQGFKTTLEYNGVGYRANVSGDFLMLGLGYSHDIAVFIPKELKISIGKPNLIIIEGSDKELVGKMSASIISLRKTEPYKGKGIKKVGQYVVRKEGKKK